MGNLLAELEAIKAILAEFQNFNLSQLEADLAALGAEGQKLGADAAAVAAAFAKLLADAKAQLPAAK